MSNGGTEKIQMKVSNFLKRAKEELEPFKYTSLKNALIAANKEDCEDVQPILQTIQSAIEENSGLLKLFNELVPDPNPNGGKLNYSEAVNFIDKIKKEASEIYEPFIKTLHDFKQKLISDNEPIQYLEKLMSPYPTLLKQFNIFVPIINGKESDSPDEAMLEDDESYMNDTRRQGGEDASQLHPNQVREGGRADGSYLGAGSGSEDASQIENVKKNEEQYLLKGLKDIFKDNKEAYNQIMKLFHLYILGVCSFFEFENAVEELFIEAGLEKDLDNLLKILATRNSSRRQGSWLIRPLSELVSQSSKKEGSYMRLPEEFPQSPGITPEINERWISVSSGSEGFSFKNMYEEQLTKCEDERYQMDWAITLQIHGIEALEKVHKLSQTMEAPIERGLLDKLLFRKLREIYTEDVDQVLKYIAYLPNISIPCFKQLLVDKREELLHIKEERNKTWRDLCEKNYIKSLDYRTFW